MAAKTFLRQVITNGIARYQQFAGLQVSLGAASGGAIPALRDDGTFDPSMFGAGFGADVFTCTASEPISAGALVNVWNNSGAFALRNADATIEGKEPWGFVLAAVAASAVGTVYAAGNNTAVTGLTPGPVFASKTPGGVTADVSAFGTGNVVTQVGIATSATSFNYERGISTTILIPT